MTVIKVLGFSVVRYVGFDLDFVDSVDDAIPFSSPELAEDFLARSPFVLNNFEVVEL